MPLLSGGILRLRLQSNCGTLGFEMLQYLTLPCSLPRVSPRVTHDFAEMKGLISLCILNVVK